MVKRIRLVMKRERGVYAGRLLRKGDIFEAPEPDALDLVLKRFAGYAEVKEFLNPPGTYSRRDMQAKKNK